MNWLKKTMADVAGTQEPIYGPSAIQPVTAQSPNHSVLTRDDLRWKGMNSTNVENQVFYVTTASGHVVMAQLIYSNVAGLHTTCQFNSKIFYPKDAAGKPTKEHLWCSTPLSNFQFDDTKHSVKADNCSITLSADGNSYSIKSTVSKDTVVDLTFTRAAPGFVAGADGTSHFGTDPQKPWGSMRHAIWPRCHATGTFTTRTDGPLDVRGTGVFVHALQGMKPHHAAARWNFCNWHGPTHSAILMSYTTPPSYGSTVVSVGCLCTDDALLWAGAQGASVEHTAIKGDPDVSWPEPGAVSYKWAGQSAAGKEVSAELAGDLGQRTDRVDVMAEVPKFVKQIVAGAAGTRPYIYQWITKLTLKGTDGETAINEEGDLFMEATFIS
ncbi:hypothetical protein FH972_022522 [Carpinus fangiana]|uniref:Ceramide-binding protein SVF1 n=1 Tax=Carpinus fangiana TaxID=176857 RepID=A0A5N6KT14_9ROSI|nr:hypothetical protein FH972_022522 [Carpinus fangiana]